MMTRSCSAASYISHTPRSMKFLPLGFGSTNPPCSVASISVSRLVIVSPSSASLHGDPDDRPRLEIHRVLGLVRQVRPPILSSS